MSVTASIKAMPTIADANGDLCVSQAAVLALLEAKAEEWRELADSAACYEDGSRKMGRNLETEVHKRTKLALTKCADELAGERLSAERNK
ncbi:MAG TPA: hypothetical protein VNH19_17640 [Candidatus Limnocylindrales bacterium]|nr:hypothetical protein [Candidatus Limnocylindrales bacterium]